MESSPLLRALLVAAIAFAIVLPIEAIRGKVSERQARAETVVRQFAAETSGPQVVAGPFLAITCEQAFADKSTLPCPTIYLTPRSLKAAATLPVESRHRGIYPIRLYRSDLQLKGEFEWPAPIDSSGPSPRAWKHAYVVIAVSDSRGIKAITSSLSPDTLASVRDKALTRFAVREDLGEHGARKPGTRLAFDYRMSLVGTSSLKVAPVGDTTEIRMASDWPHPSFGEAWMPDERRISNEGFEVTWRVTSIATGGQDSWQQAVAGGKILESRAAGVALFDPVNIYALSHRATEYAFLFVLFTFGALALAEAVAGIRLHPVQYALTGCAVAVFFLLLIALSEHVPFAQAYATGAGACIALLTYYLRHPLGSGWRTAVFFALFATLYGSLYGLLKSEDNALLMGSLMVFALLAIGMIATRKMDWAAIAPKTA